MSKQQLSSSIYQSTFLNHTASFSDLNNNFTLTLAVTAMNETNPRSHAPLYFTANPRYASEQGFSIGHGPSKGYLELRMSDGMSLSVVKFTFPDQVLGEQYTYTVTCWKYRSHRTCSLAVNGVQASPPTHNVPVPREIYDHDGGLFGHVWYWRFVGILHSIAVSVPKGPPPTATAVPLTGIVRHTCLLRTRLWSRCTLVVAMAAVLTQAASGKCRTKIAPLAA